jgi:hypothetical protein
MQAAETASLDLANTESALFGLENTRKSSKNITNGLCLPFYLLFILYNGEKKVQDEKLYESKQVL